MSVKIYFFFCLPSLNISSESSRWTSFWCINTILNQTFPIGSSNEYREPRTQNSYILVLEVEQPNSVTGSRQELFKPFLRCSNLERRSTEELELKGWSWSWSWREKVCENGARVSGTEYSRISDRFGKISASASCLNYRRLWWHQWHQNKSKTCSTLEIWDFWQLTIFHYRNRQCYWIIRANNINPYYSGRQSLGASFWTKIRRQTLWQTILHDH